MKRILAYFAVGMMAAGAVMTSGQTAYAGPESTIPAQTGAATGGNLQNAVAHSTKISKLKATHSRAGSKIQKREDLVGRPPDWSAGPGQVNRRRRGR